MSTRTAKLAAKESNGVTTRIPKKFGVEITSSPLLGMNLTSSDLQLVSRSVLPLTHAAALKHLKLPSITDAGLGLERPLRDDHVAFLSKQMQEGLFRPEQVQLITCDYAKPGEKPFTYRMNGQHTCWARSSMPANWPCTVQKLHYVASTPDAVRRLYGSIDRGAGRTPRHLILNYLHGSEGFDTIPAHTLGTIAPGLNAYISGGIPRKARTPDELAHLMTSNNSPPDGWRKQVIIVAKLLGSLYGDADSRHMARSGVIGAMFATMIPTSGDLSKWTKFWEVVRDGVGVRSKYDPRIRLRNHLMLTNNKTGSRRTRRIQTSDDMYRTCIGAWNFYRANEPCKVLHTHFQGGERTKPK